PAAPVAAAVAGLAGLPAPADRQAGVALAADGGADRQVAPNLPFEPRRRAALAAADDLEVEVVVDVAAAGDGEAGGLAAEGQAVQPGQFAQIADDVETAAAGQRRHPGGQLGGLE